MERGKANNRKTPPMTFDLKLKAGWPQAKQLRRETPH
jgi:hypothetical protein